MSSKEYTYRWNPQKDFLEKYRALMERVKQGDHSAYYQVKELRTKEYRKIVFAILDDHNAHQSHNPEGNLKPFADEFTKRDV